MILFYFNLLIKKAINYVHNLIEKRSEINSKNNIEKVKFLLSREIFTNLKTNNSGIFVETKVKNSKKPLLLTQARYLLILSLQNEDYSNTAANKWLISKVTTYIKNQRNKEGYYTFNYPSWDKQDEGIATIWALISLLKAYKILDDNTLLEFILETTYTMLEKFYSKETSLVHTKDDKFWCLNGASTLAWFLSDLLKYKYDEIFESALNNSIQICLNNQNNMGFFPYSEKRRGTYLLLYNPIVIYTLDQCKNSPFLKDSIKLELKPKLDCAREFILSNLDIKKYFVEPEVTNYSRYIISNVTSLVSLKGYIPEDLELKILENISRYFKDDKFFLCVDDEYRLYNSSLFRLKDQLSIETLYWLETYEKLV